jgi:hypothetical protein
MLINLQTYHLLKNRPSNLYLLKDRQMRLLVLYNMLLLLFLQRMCSLQGRVHIEMIEEEADWMH